MMLQFCPPKRGGSGSGSVFYGLGNITTPASTAANYMQLTCNCYLTPLTIDSACMQPMPMAC